MDFIEPCFGIGHNLSLICQMTSEDIKHQLIIIVFRFVFVKAIRNNVVGVGEIVFSISLLKKVNYF